MKHEKTIHASVRPAVGDLMTAFSIVSPCMSPGNRRFNRAHLKDRQTRIPNAASLSKDTQHLDMPCR